MKIIKLMLFLFLFSTVKADRKFDCIVKYINAGDFDSYAAYLEKNFYLIDESDFDGHNLEWYIRKSKNIIDKNLWLNIINACRCFLVFYDPLDQSDLNSFSYK